MGPLTYLRKWLGDYGEPVAVQIVDPESTQSQVQDQAMSASRALYILQDLVRLLADNASDATEAPEQTKQEIAQLRSAIATLQTFVSGEIDDVISAATGATKALTFRKDASGRTRWLSITSNNFEDRDGETLTEQAHKAFESAVASGVVPAPELWLWHTPGSKIGSGDFVGYSDGFLVTSGLIDAGKEKAAETLAALPDLGCSHGFYGVKEGSTIVQYISHEVSALPVASAANAWTALDLITKELTMPFATEKRAFLTSVLGEDTTKQLEATLGDSKARLEAAGVRSKEVAALEAPAPAPAAAAVTPPAAAQVPPKADDEPEEDAIGKAIAKALDVPGLTAMLKSMSDGQVGMIKAITDLAERVATQETRIAELGKSDDQKIAETLAPKSRNAPIWQGFKASESPETAISKAEAEKAGKPAAGMEWLDSILTNTVGEALVR